VRRNCERTTAFARKFVFRGECHENAARPFRDLGPRHPFMPRKLSSRRFRRWRKRRPPRASRPHSKSTAEIFKILGKAARGKKCPAIDGLIEEGEEVIKDADDDTVRDAGMLAAAQTVEHYEISRYGTLKAWADKLGMDEISALLDETLQEEKATDAKLTDLAESEINIRPTRKRRRRHA
jgi:ferritin-like metal-binding protein YciE